MGTFAGKKSFPHDSVSRRRLWSTGKGRPQHLSWLKPTRSSHIGHDTFANREQLHAGYEGLCLADILRQDRPTHPPPPLSPSGCWGVHRNDKCRRKPSGHLSTEKGYLIPVLTRHEPQSSALQVRDFQLPARALLLVSISIVHLSSHKYFQINL